jgi:DNA repair ATPase RecN
VKDKLLQEVSAELERILTELQEIIAKIEALENELNFDQDDLDRIKNVFTGIRNTLINGIPEEVAEAITEN